MQIELSALSGSWIKQPDSGTPFSHGSSLLLRQDGSLLAAWFGGTFEAEPDTGIYLARSPRWDAGWSAPELVIPAQGCAHGNAVLFEVAGTVYLAYFRCEGEWCGDGVSWFRTSRDAVAWSSPRVLCGQAGILIKNKPCWIGDRLALPAYDERTWTPCLLWSDDGGASWELQRLACPVRAIQGSLLPGFPTALLLRSDLGELLKMTSLDGGSTWTAPEPTGLGNPNSGLDAVRLWPEGPVLLAHNPGRSAISDILDPVQRDGRYPLQLTLGSPDLKRWQEWLVLERHPGEYSYPALISAGNRLALSYTYARRAIRCVRLCWKAEGGPA